MSAPVGPAVRRSSVLLTPPTGTRTTANRPVRRRRRTRASNSLGFKPNTPTALHFIAAAGVYSLAPWVIALFQKVSLQHDDLFAAVVYLASNGRSDARHVASLVVAAIWVNFAATCVLLASALLPQGRHFERLHAVANRFYGYAIALPLWTILVANLDRFTANGAHSLRGFVSWDLTAIFARAEGPFIAWLQHAVAGPSLSTFASNFDSTLWLAPIAFAGVLLAATDRRNVMNSLIVAYVLTALLAVPLFVLLPTFEPWTTNALYGAKGIATNVRYLHPNPSLPLLTRINTQFHWATASAFPNLRVAVPLVAAFVLRRHSARAMSLVMIGIAVMSGVVGVYLGRHWMVDAVAAVPFSLSVFALESRIPFNVILRARTTTAGTLRPGEIAVVNDPNEDAVRWLFSRYFRQRLVVLYRDASTHTLVALARVRRGVLRRLSRRRRSSSRRRSIPR